MRLMRLLRRNARKPQPAVPKPTMLQGRVRCLPPWYSARTEALLIWGRAGNLTPGQMSRSSALTGPTRINAECVPVTVRLGRLERNRR